MPKTDFYVGLFIGMLFCIVVIVYIGISGSTLVSCPTEDSCYPDYRNGAWYIVQGER